MLVQYSGNAQEMLQALNDAGFLENGIIRNWEDRNAFHVTNHDRAKKAAEARWAKRNEKLLEKKERDKDKEKEKESKQAQSKHCLDDAPSIEVIEKPTRLLWEIKFGLELPESLRTQECQEAVNLWLAYKSERRQAYKPIGLKAALTEWGREYTADQFPSIVQNSIAKNWQGIHHNKPATQTTFANANDPIARRNAALGDIAAHSAEATRRSREIDRLNDLRYEQTGKTPFDP
jgi:hypothetical protein